MYIVTYTMIMAFLRALTGFLLAVSLTSILAASGRPTSRSDRGLAFSTESGLESGLANVTHSSLENLHIEAIKKYILTKLGMTEVPDLSRVNTSTQERRKILRLYKKSIEELGKSNSAIDDDEDLIVPQFNSFTEHGQLCLLPMWV